MQHQDLNDLYYYVQVVDHGGFAPAGRALGMPKSKLSRRIAFLEQRLGVRLIQRSTRRFAVTELGQAYYQRCKAVIVEAEAAQTVIESTHAGPCGTLRVSCPIALLHAHISPMLISFAVTFPAVSIELVGMNRKVDIVAEGIDVALRMLPAPLDDNNLAVRVLAYETPCLVTSPSLQEKYGVVHSPVDLAAWPTLGYGPPVEHHVWDLLGPNGAQAAQHHTPRLVTTDMVTLRRAALAGLGAVQLPMMMVREELSNGSLNRLLPDWSIRQEIVHAVFPTRRGLLPSVRALIDHFVEQFAGAEKTESITMSTKLLEVSKRAPPSEGLPRTRN